MAEGARIWPLVPLNEVTEDVHSWDPSLRPDVRFTYVDISAVDNESCRIVGARTLLGREAPSRARRPIQDGDVLFSNVRTYLRNVALVEDIDQPAVASTGFTVLRPTERVYSRYLFHLARSDYFIGKVTPEQTGTHYPATSDRVVRSQCVPVPDVPTQEAVARVLDAIDAGTSEAEVYTTAGRQAVRRFRQAVLAAACTGRVTSDWRSRCDTDAAQLALDRRRLSECKRLGRKYREPRLPDRSPLPDIPETWTWAMLPEIGEMGRGKSMHRPRNDPTLYGGEYPFIQTGDVARSGGRITGHSQTYNERGLAQSRLWPARTVCITIAANIADSALLTYPACFPDSVVGVITDEEVAVPEYIELFVRTARRDLAAFAPATAQANINLAILSELAVALPPLEEQREIVRLTTELFRDAAAIEERLEVADRRIRKTVQSVLTKAFHGELVS